MNPTAWRSFILNCTDLIKWVVDACSLQVSSYVIQESVVLFWVGQAWILVVSFNICQQRPDGVQRVTR